MSAGGEIAIAILLAFGIGFAGGLRTFMPLAALRLPHRDWTTAVALACAVAELIGDKLPGVPSRLLPGPLVGRCVVGGYAGLVIGGKLGLDLSPAVLIGIAGAICGALSGASYRTWVAANHLPDLWFALAEDAAAVAIAFSIALAVA
ncbi:MAG: hypothetical protein WCE44_03710 [Candidatus Velthaea sp.]